MRRFALVFIFLALAVGAWAIPGVLIVQQMAPNDSVGDPNVTIGNMLATSLETEGVMAPVVWSQTDPIFRAAVTDGIIKDDGKEPDLATAQRVASKLHLDYILFVRCYQYGNNLMGRISLYKGGKLVWKDPEKDTEMLDPNDHPEPVKVVKNGQTQTTTPKQKVLKFDSRPFAVTGPNGLSIDDTSASIVRTWTMWIKTGPFKGQAISPKILTPDASPGQAPILPNDPIVPKVKATVDNKQLLSDLDAMVKGGQSVQAILMLRDAVDVAPQDVTRRIALVRTLILLGQPELAAKEARRAAELLPDKIELRAMAARAWMQAGREDEAMADLNEAVARDPNSVETRTLLAEVNLSKGRPQQALEHLDAVLKEKPSGEIWFQHALCKALLGKRDDVLSDLAEAKKAGLSASPQDVAARYSIVASLLDKSVSQCGNDVRSLMQRAQVRRTDPEVGQISTTQRDLVASWGAFLSAIDVPQLHRSSHDRRVLAFNLLSQSLGDLGNFLASNDEDALAESRINLGEALKQYGLAQGSYKDEIGGIAKRVGSD